MKPVRRILQIAAVLVAAAMIATSTPLYSHAQNSDSVKSTAKNPAAAEDADSAESADNTVTYYSRKEAAAPKYGLERQGWIPEYSRTAPEGTLVLLLDPGHDITHGGAQNGNLYEHELVFKIASYCKQALEEYANVEVHLTRTSNDCPYPHSANGDDLYQRVMQGRTIGADAYISFHLNAGFQKSGSQVWVQSTRWKPELNEKGKKLGESILKELSGLGLHSEGTFATDSSTMRYPDGSRADDLTVMRAGKRIDLLTVLIEHCYLSYAPDVQNHLSTEEQLQALGEADARGIAAYFGLSYIDDTDIFEADRAATEERLAAYNAAIADDTPAETDTPAGSDTPAETDTPAGTDTPAAPKKTALLAMYRIYCPRTHEHLYTSDLNEIRTLLKNRWRYEGVAWYAPVESATPVYRLFNPGSGEHFYTADSYERHCLLESGAWNDENIGWYSDDAQGVPVYRMFYAGLPAIACHHYTSDAYEYRVLTTQNGWTDEAVAWYGASLE